MGKVALIIIYNHQYNKNIEVLEKIYGNRFSNIYHLMPFYCEKKENVLPVYESSHYFQGYVTQGFRTFFKAEYQHYLFIADDLILNPAINENNYTTHFKLDATTSFCPGFIPLHECSFSWPRVSEAYTWKYGKGVEIRTQIPDYSEALRRFEKFGLNIAPVTFHQPYRREEMPKSFIAWLKPFGRLNNFYAHSRLVYRYLRHKTKEEKHHLSYPMVGGYSDIFVIDSQTITKFAHYCGVFAAAELFVELALPTSLVLSANQIVTEKDLEKRGKVLWNESLKKFEEQNIYGNNLKKLLENFPPELLYFHPIKLSKWDTTGI